MSAKLASASVWFFFDPTCTTYLVGVAAGVIEAVCVTGFGFAAAGTGMSAAGCGAAAGAGATADGSAAGAGAGAGPAAASCISAGASAGAVPGGGAMTEPSGRTTMVFTLRGPPSAALGSSTDVTVGGAEPSTACVVGGEPRSVEATGVGPVGA